MKRFLSLFLILLVGCNSERGTNNYESIRQWGREAKANEQRTYNQSHDEMAAVHKEQQAKYNDYIKHPENHLAEWVDLSNQTNTTSVAPTTTSPTATLPEASNGLPAFNDNTPEHFTLPPKTRAISPDCKNGNCPLKEQK